MNIQLRPNPAPAGFGNANLAKSGSGRIWETWIRYSPTYYWRTAKKI